MRTHLLFGLVLLGLMSGCGIGQRYVHVEHDYEEGYDDGSSHVVEHHVHYDEPATHHGYSGYTECGDFFAPAGDVNTCQPGSFCSDATFSKCAPGCLSDQNCSPEQVCVKQHARNRGTCQAM